VRRCLLPGRVKCLESEKAIAGVESERLLIHPNGRSVSCGELTCSMTSDEGSLAGTGGAEEEEVVGGWGGRGSRRHDERRILLRSERIGSIFNLKGINVG